MKKILIFIIGMLIMSGCVSYRYISTEPEMKSVYIGKDLRSIISLNGAPNREVSDGVGGKIMIYEKYYSKSDTYYGYRYSNTSTQYKCNYIEFYIDGNNICYDVRTNIVDREKKIEWGGTILWSIVIIVSLFPLLL